MTRGLTEKQESILRYIVQKVRENGYPPTIREIGDAFDISSLRGVTVHLDALQRKNYIEREHKSRSIKVIHPDFLELTDNPDSVAHVPLVGEIAAGLPIFADQNIEAHIPLPIEMVRNIENPFILRVKGDSMIDAHIMPNDFVVIRTQSVVSENDIAAVLVNDEATIKRVKVGEGVVRLIPANDRYTVMEYPAEEVSIIGKVVGLLRSLDRPF